jgi:hypothetical protein
MSNIISNIIVFILFIIPIITLSILIFKYYNNCPNKVIEYKYINKSCSDIEQIPTSLLFKNLFETPDEWLGQSTLL